jgi:hypothetical protein
MTTAAAGQAEAAVEQAPFVALSDAVAEREPEAAPTPESTESEPVEASEADDKTPLDDIEYDENDPAQKAAYEALRKKMLPKWQARVEALKKQPKEGETQPQAPAEQPAPQEAAQGEWDPLTVNFGDFKPTLKFREGSDLEGYSEELQELFADANRQAIEFTLKQIRANEGQLREQQLVGQAQQAIGAYAQILYSHPDWDEHSAEVEEFAAVSGDLAKRNPEKWIRAVEGITGIKRPKPAGAEESESETPREQPRKPTANKAHAIVERPTRPAMTPTPSAGNMTLQAALDKALKARRG